MKRKTKHVMGSVPVLLLVWALASCASQTSAEDSDIIDEKGIVYAVRGDEELQLDMARPSGKEGPYPALIFVHGGGLKAGSRDALWPVASIAAMRGYVAATIDYRHTKPVGHQESEEYGFPAQLHDVKAAIRWLREHAAEYEVNGNNIGMVGMGAGAQLTMLCAFTKPEDGLEGPDAPYERSSTLQAAVSVAGLCDLTQYRRDDRYVDDNVQRLLGGSREEVPEMYERASPVSYVTTDDTPTLAIFAGKDRYRYPSRGYHESWWVDQWERLTEAALEFGASHNVLVRTTAPHDFFRLATPLDDYPMWGFLDMWLKL